MKVLIELGYLELKAAIESGTLIGLADTVEGAKAVNAEVAEQTKKGVKAKPNEDPEVAPEKDEVTATEPTITEVDIRAKFVALSKKGKKAELKQLLTDFGVEKVSDLQPDQYQDAMEKLEAM